MIQIPTIPKKSKTSNRNLFDRYQHWWGLPDEFEYFTLGEGRTPIVPFRYRDRNITGKLEYLSPSGSYKDRGAALMISVLK
jgi:threonine synthase